MRSLSKRDLSSRRVFDWQIVRRMHVDRRYVFSGHRTARDAERGRNPIDREDQAKHATHYRAVYHTKTLVGPGKYSPYTIIRIDLSGVSYPFEQPSAWVVEKRASKMPFSPHFARGVPICNGTIWKSDGHVTLGHYLIHLARLLNWDENLDSEYGGYNRDALLWWRRHLNRPLDPNLQYPRVPPDLLYGEVVVRSKGGFRPAKQEERNPRAGGFRPMG